MALFPKAWKNNQNNVVRVITGWSCRMHVNCDRVRSWLGSEGLAIKGLELRNGKVRCKVQNRKSGDLCLCSLLFEHPFINSSVTRLYVGKTKLHLVKWEHRLLRAQEASSICSFISNLITNQNKLTKRSKSSKTGSLFCVTHFKKCVLSTLRRLWHTDNPTECIRAIMFDLFTVK